MTPPVQPVEILLAEDNPADVRLTREALKEGWIANRLNVVPDGEETLKYLRRQPPYADKPMPDLLLLDLNMPRKNGLEVLQEIKSSTKLRKLPVVVLTTSRAEEDILRSYEHHANCYISKPVDLARFIEVVKSIENFWLTVVSLPPRHH